MRSAAMRLLPTPLGPVKMDDALSDTPGSPNSQGMTSREGKLLAAAAKARRSLDFSVAVAMVV